MKQLVKQQAKATKTLTHEMKLDYEVIVTDKSGKVVSREKGESHSLLKGYSQLVYGGVTGAAQTIKCTDGVDRPSGTGSFYTLMDANAVAGVDAKGIVVGGDDTPVTITDYKLGSQFLIAQLDHLATTWTTPANYDALECRFPIKRIFLNASGSDVTVKEAGMYAVIDMTVPVHYTCIIRDVLVTPQVIPDGGAMTVVYTFRIVLA